MACNNDDFSVKSQDITESAALQKRARSKYLTRALMLSLVNSVPGSTLKSKYWNSYHCANQLEQTSYKHFEMATGVESMANHITSKYCKNRFCLVCNRIRTAYYINNYEKQLKDWDLYFVTLTLRNVKQEMLVETYDSMNEILRLTKKNIRRKKGNNIVRGVRKLETTYNQDFNDYHPHYHILIDGKNIAEMFIDYWVKYANEFNFVVDRNLQDIRKADINTMREVFKYFTKLIIKSKDGKTSFNPYVINNIFESLSMKKRNIIEPFGFKLEREITERDWDIFEKMDEEKKSETEDYQVFEWEQELHDWINKNTGELKSGYTPDEKFKDFVLGIAKK